MRTKSLSLLAILALLLSACGGSSSETDSSAVISADVDTTDSADQAAVEQPANEEAAPYPEADGASSGGQMDGKSRTISEQEEYIIGVFNLESTNLAITSDQAASLIQLWNSMLELTQHQPQAAGQKPDEAAQPEEPQENTEEITALFEEIQAVMTDEQLQAITLLELDQDAVTAFIEEQGIEMGNGMQSGQAGQTPPEGIPPDEEMSAPEGSPPVDAQGNGSSGPGSDGETPTGGDGQLQGEGSMGGGHGGFLQTASSNLIEALIELLESRISS